MIGQKDNKLNIETAAASRRIAEIGLGHNNAMKEMAEDSRHIAVLTRKDSADMRIIAVVTLLFLPGTFMATFFSADFFNFLQTDSRQIVSKWIWLYFALTGATTFIVFFAWYLSSKKQNKEILPVTSVASRPSIPRAPRPEYQSSIEGLMAQTTISSMWMDRSASNGHMERLASYGSSPDPGK